MCHSEWGPQAGSFGTARDSVTNAGSQALPQASRLRICILITPRDVCVPPADLSQDTGPESNTEASPSKCRSCPSYDLVTPDPTRAPPGPHSRLASVTVPASGTRILLQRRRTAANRHVRTRLTTLVTKKMQTSQTQRDCASHHGDGPEIPGAPQEKGGPAPSARH